MISLDNQVVSDKMAILGTIIGKGAVRMEAHERVLHELLKMGEMLLGCGAEINRVEDTMMRLVWREAGRHFRDHVGHCADGAL